jgi:cbb3-type cytochrome oxidase subunit 3
MRHGCISGYVSGDTVVSWKTFALFVVFPPLAVLAIVLFPLTLLVVYILYIRGKRQQIDEE